MNTTRYVPRKFLRKKFTDAEYEKFIGYIREAMQMSGGDTGLHYTHSIYGYICAATKDGVFFNDGSVYRVADGWDLSGVEKKNLDR